ELIAAHRAPQLRAEGFYLWPEWMHGMDGLGKWRSARRRPAILSRGWQRISYIAGKFSSCVRNPRLPATQEATRSKGCTTMRCSRLASLLLPASLCVLAPALAAPRATADALALDNVHIVEAEHNRVSGRRCVRVQDTRITAVTDAGDPACLRSARVADQRGRYLMPGLIDMHAHLTLGPMEIRRERGRAVMQALPDDDIAGHNARRLVAFGVTTIRNPGGDLPAAARYEARLAAGELVGPESFNAGPVIHNAELPGLATAARNAGEMEQVVAAQVEAGADWIKLYTGLSPELLKAGIDAAHRHGRSAVAHLEGIAWPDALEMGLDGIVHLMPVSPDLLTPEQRSAWRATARGSTYSFFEWWEHFDPEGPQAARLV